MSEIPIWTMGKCPSCKKKITVLDRKEKQCSGCGDQFTFSKRGTVGVVVFFLIIFGVIGKSCSNSPDSEKVASEKREKVEQKAVIDKTMMEKKAEEAAIAESSQLDLDISLFCERLVKEKLTIPKSASFDAGTERHTYKPTKDRKSVNAVLHEEFTYKNAFNAELPGVFVCEVDVSDWKKNKVLTLVNLKVGRP